MGKGSTRMGGSGGWETRASWDSNGKGMGFGMRMNKLQLTQYMQSIKHKLKHDLKDLIHDVMRDAADDAKFDGLSLSSSLKNEAYGIISDAIDVRDIEHGQYAGSRMYVAPEPLGPRRDDGGGSGVDLAVLYSQQKGPWDYGFDMKKKEKKVVWNTASFRGSSRFAKFPILQKAGRPFQFPGIGGSSPIKRYDFIGIAEKYFDVHFEPRMNAFLRKKLEYNAR